MHALRRRVLLKAVEALLDGRRLTLIDVAQAWPGAQRVRAPLKALDRLLGNRLFMLSASRSTPAWRTGWCVAPAQSSLWTGRS